MIRDFSLNKLL